MHSPQPLHAARIDSRAPLRVALIGLGAIGSTLAAALQATPGVVLVGVLLRQAPPAGALPADLPWVATLPALLALQPQLVVEAAGQAALAAHGPALLAAGCDLLPASVGALADAALLQALDQAARSAGRQVLLPAGALAGLDWLGAAALAGLQQVHYRGRKPPAAWAGTAADGLIKLATVQQAQVFFRGSAREAALMFPKNANVAATLALATLGLDAVTVELIADPHAAGNQHEIEAEGAAGSFRLQVCNAPLPSNPRSSLVTAYSLLRCIRARAAGVVA